jgi:DNA-binding MarR family transcriptional regulator
MVESPVDVSALALSGSASKVLQQLIEVGGRSVSQLAVEIGVSESMVSRAVRDLMRCELLEHNGGRPATVSLAPGVGDAVRAMARQLRESARERADALEELGALLDKVAPEPWQDGRVHWLVPLRADAHQQEDVKFRTAAQSFAACVPRGQRPRGAPRRAAPYGVLQWRVLMEDDWPRTERRLPWLEIVDDGAAAIQLGAHGCGRIAWSRDRHQVALALAGFESWWSDAEPVLTLEAGSRARAAQSTSTDQSTSAAQPLARATAERQRR